MARTFPSLRHRFLRIFIGIAAFTTLLISTSLSTDEYLYQRRTQIENMQQVADAVSHIVLLVSTHHKASQLTDYLESFKDNTRLVRLCLYDADARLISFWQRNNEGNCPALITKTGVETDAFFVRIAMPMEQGGQYIGIIYAQGELYTLKQWLICVSKVLASLFAVSLAASWFAARLSTNSIVPPLLALRRQIDCLKGNDIIACAIPSYAMTEETAALSSGIASLRSYFDETTVPKETLTNVRGWHWEVLSELLATLRHRVSADSPLIEGLNDYALLLQTIRGDMLPPPRQFDLAHTLDAALSAARTAIAQDAHVSLTASLSADMPRQWSGQPEMMETLLRHLLLIGLKRTRNGFVCLRLQTYAQNNLAIPNRVRIRLEDSGPFIQRWQLQQWLTFSMDDVPPKSMTGDISWLLSSRLFKRLNGTLDGESDKDGGLVLEGNLPLSPYNAEQQTVPAAVMPAHRVPPIVLVVEGNKDNVDSTTRLFAEAGCQAFVVSTHLQALEWVPVLPFSAIILNVGMSDATPDITRRLRHMMEDGAMPHSPLWATTARFSFVDFDYWRRQGVEELLLKPSPLEMLKRLVASLQPRNEVFYLAHNQQLRDDMTDTITAFPEVNRMLAEQIMQVEPALQALANHEIPQDGRHRPHSVRSAALTLGYFRLAALMGQIEHASISPRLDFPVRNWTIISDVMKSTSFE